MEVIRGRGWDAEVIPDAQDEQARQQLHPDMVLQRVGNVRVLLTGSGTSKVTVPGGTVELGAEGLRLLERFARPTTIREAVAEEGGGIQQWMDATNTIAGLVEYGVLYDVRTGPPRDEVKSHGFDNPRSHIQMLDDHVRTSRFIAAVEATVRPGDVVVDVGTGTGILAMAAARAGAAQVYAVEAGAIADQAERVIAANGFADTITVLRGWSTSVSLPRRADVLVTETLGTDPLDERILEIVTDARRRLLTPAARIVPSLVHLDATAVEIPERDIASFVYTSAWTRRWEAEYGFDLGPLVASDRRLRDYRIPIPFARNWLPLAPAARLESFDLRTVTSTSVNVDAKVQAARGGRLDGALLHFEAELAPGISLSTNPRERASPESWATALTLRSPVEVVPGRSLHLTYARNVRSATPGLSVDVVG